MHALRMYTGGKRGYSPKENQATEWDVPHPYLELREDEGDGGRGACRCGRQVDHAGPRPPKVILLGVDRVHHSLMRIMDISRKRVM